MEARIDVASSTLELKRLSYGAALQHLTINEWRHGLNSLLYAITERQQRDSGRVGFDRAQCDVTMMLMRNGFADRRISSRKCGMMGGGRAPEEHSHLLQAYNQLPDSGSRISAVSVAAIYHKSTKLPKDLNKESGCIIVRHSEHILASIHEVHP
jgi:hypothetical protein